MFCRSAWVIVWLLCASKVLAGYSSLREIDALELADTLKIDLITDQAWELARKNPDTAVAWATEAIERANLAGPYVKGLINAHTLLGIINKDRGFYSSAVEHHLAAKQLAEQSKDHLRLSGCLNNLGSVYQQQGDYYKALDLFKQSLEIETTMGKNKEQQSIRLFNIGESYLKLDSLDQAYAYYYQSLLIESELNNQEGIFYARLGIGLADSRRNNFSKAEEELQNALKIAILLPNLPGQCEALLALGHLRIGQGQYALAVEKLDSAKRMAKGLGYQGLELQAYEALAQAYKQQGNLLLSLESLEKYYQLKEKVNSAAVNSRIAELNMKYEVEKRQASLELAQKDLQMKAADAKYERKLRNYLLFTVLVSVVLILLNLRKKRRLQS